MQLSPSDKENLLAASKGENNVPGFSYNYENDPAKALGVNGGNEKPCDDYEMQGGMEEFWLRISLIIFNT